MSLEKKWFIYGLSDPREPEQIRYVGFTSIPIEKRLGQHIYQASYEGHTKNHKNHWIRSLLEEGVQPVVELLESGSGGLDTWIMAEREWIFRCIARGFSLTNSLLGGYSAIPTEESRKNMSQANKGRLHSIETRAKLSEIAKERSSRPEIRERLLAQVGSPEARAKSAASHRGKKHSAEHCAKISAANKGRISSPERNSKLSKALKGRVIKPEWTAKRVATFKANLTDESRAQISARAKAAASSRRVKAAVAAVSLEEDAQRSAAAKSRFATLMRGPDGMVLPKTDTPDA